MKKYSFSKKVAGVMLATVLVVQPMASALPLVGSAVVQAEEVAELIQIIDEKLGQGEAINIATSFAKIGLSTTADQLENDLNAFRSDNREAFNTLFEGELSTDDLISFFVTFMNAAEDVLDDMTKEEIEAEIIAEGYYNFIGGIAEEAIRQDNKDVDGILKKHIGIGILDIVVDMQKELDKQLNMNNASLRQAMADALYESLDEIRILNESSTISDIANAIGTVYEKLDSNSKTIIQNARSKVNAGDVNWNAVFASVQVNLPVKDEDESTGGGGGSTGGGGGSAGGGGGSAGGGGGSAGGGGGSTGGGGGSAGGGGGSTGGGGGSTGGGEGSTGDGGDTVEAPEDATTVEREGDKAVTKVDGEKIADFVQANPEADRLNFTLEREAGEVAELRLPKQAIDALSSANNKNLVVDVVSEDGSISIPVSELSNEKIRAALGLTASSTDDFEVSITIAVVSGSQATSIKNSLESRVSGASVKSDVVDFTMSVRSGEREAKLTRFDSYIFRSIPVAGVTNPQFAIAYNVDATPVIVPTQGGTESVRFASRMLSKYVVAERTPLPFTDLRADFWAKPEIDRLSVRNVFQGRSDGRVAPGESVTRVQLSVLLSRSLAMISDSEYKKQFSDVTGDEWFMDEFLPIVETGIVQGRRDGSFAPNAPVTRQQAAAMISRAMDQIGFDDSKLGTANAENTYSDFDRIDDYAKEDVERLLQAGIMEGRNDGTFGPKEPMTRAQMARVIDSLLKFQGFMN